MSNYCTMIIMIISALPIWWTISITSIRQWILAQYMYMLEEYSSFPDNTTGVIINVWWSYFVWWRASRTWSVWLWSAQEVDCRISSAAGCYFLKKTSANVLAVSCNAVTCCDMVSKFSTTLQLILRFRSSEGWN